jgi:TRAP-type uncharacterized transport system substrate-binding protein
VIAAFAAAFGIAHDYGYLHASILTGSPKGWYYTLASRVADRARREHGSLVVVPTAGSVENVSRLATGRGYCTEMFALIQDGIPVPADARLELLGRLPEFETLLLLGRSDHAIRTFSDLRGAAIGIGPEGSGTAYLMHQLFEDSDLRDLDVHLLHHGLSEQALLVAQNKLNLAAFVMEQDAEFLRNVVREHDLDIVAPQDLQGLVARYPWLSLGQIPAGRYDLVRRIPATDKQVARLGTLVIANQCAQRSDRIALLMLLAAEFPSFVHNNPPSATAAATVLPLAPESQQFFRTGEQHLASEAAAMKCRPDAKWNADQRCHQHRADAQLEGGGKPFHEQRRHRNAKTIRNAEIAAQRLAKKSEELNEYRIIEAERAAHDLALRKRGSLPHHVVDGVADISHDLQCLRDQGLPLDRIDLDLDGVRQLVDLGIGERTNIVGADLADRRVDHILKRGVGVVAQRL